MPAARESLLDAAYVALARLPWPAVRMVDVAAAAGVSRQTLYNEFGGKDGLARALVSRTGLRVPSPSLRRPSATAPAGCGRAGRAGTP
ncbi:TetR/AcrR family transcriptional regulator, partial [Streptomyces seoulensis]